MTFGAPVNLEGTEATESSTAVVVLEMEAAVPAPVRTPLATALMELRVLPREVKAEPVLAKEQSLLETSKAPGASTVAPAAEARLFLVDPCVAKGELVIVVALRVLPRVVKIELVGAAVSLGALGDLFTDPREFKVGLVMAPE